MKSSKNHIYITVTVAVVVFSCMYLFYVDKAYGGAVYVSLTAWFFTMPLIALMQLYRSLKKIKEKKPDELTLWVIMGLAFAIALYILIKSSFYSLSIIQMFIFLLFGAVALLIDKKRAKNPAKNPVFEWAIGFVSIYAFASGSTFGYLKILKPVTVAEASIIIDETYGADKYEFSHNLNGNLNGLIEETSLGVYWFDSINNQPIDDILVYVNTGEIAELND